MSYQREEYKKYLNNNGIGNTSPYCSCLDKIEKTLQVDIDAEYAADQCERLLQTLLKLRGTPDGDAKKYGQYKNLMSKLNKYCQFRKAPDQPAAPKVAAKEIPQPRYVPEEPEETFFFNTNGMTAPMEVYLRKCTSFEQFKERYLEEFLSRGDGVGQYLEKLLWKYDKNQTTVSHEAGLSPAYVGNIVRGRNADPSRDVLLAICLAIGTTVDEAQYLLRYAGHSPLYVRRMRDVIIWFGLMKKQSVTQVNMDLDANGFEPIIPKRKDTTESISG